MIYYYINLSFTLWYLEADEMEKQFPYSDHELADEDKPEQSDGKKTFFQVKFMDIRIEVSQ